MRSWPTNERTLALQADLLATTEDTGQLADLAKPTLVGQRRVPGPKLHDDRVIRLLETLLHHAAFATEWSTRELHTRPPIPAAASQRFTTTPSTPRFRR